MSSLFIFVKVVTTKMTTTQPQRASASKMFAPPPDRPPQYGPKKKYTPPLYSEYWGEDWTVDQLFETMIRDLFAEYVGIMRVGKYELWTWKGSQSDIFKIQLQLSWVMGTRSLELNNPSDLMREIVSGYRENCASDSTWTFERLFGDVRFSIPKSQE